jgi:hypothetical protein
VKTRFDPDFDLMGSMCLPSPKEDTHAPKEDTHSFPLTGVFEEGPYRYRLWRIWDRALPMVCWVMLNPGADDTLEDDLKVVKFSRAWGYGGLVVVNLFAYRASDPSELLQALNGGTNVVGRFNDQHIMVAMDMCPKLTVAAWGSDGNMGCRAARMFKLCREALGGGRVLHSLKVNGDGTPSHPLYLPDNSTPSPYPKK